MLQLIYLYSQSSIIKQPRFVTRSTVGAEMMLQRRGTGLTQVFYITVRTIPPNPSTLPHPGRLPQRVENPPLKMREAFSIG